MHTAPGALGFAWLWPTLTVLAALALVACTRREPDRRLGRYLLPAVRTVALITVTAAYVAALFTMRHP